MQAFIIQMSAQFHIPTPLVPNIERFLPDIVHRTVLQHPNETHHLPTTCTIYEK